MSPLGSWSSAAGAPARSGHLDRLHSSLLDLDERLGEAVPQAIGQAAAAVVCQAVVSLLGQGGGPAVVRFSPRPADRGRPLWETVDGTAEERDRPPWFNERAEVDNFLSDRDGALDDEDEQPVAVARPSFWHQALAAALPALGWWLHRRVGGRAVGAALGCGLVCGLALHLGGRRAAGTGLALTLLTESVGAVAALGVREQS